jgi:phosphatidylinositol alpha-1,6-mannosyltransferase
VPQSSGQRQVLALLPSRGRGGGIESYCEGVLHSLALLQVVVIEVALLDCGDEVLTWRGKMRFAWRATRAAWREQADIEILCFHAGLLPVALLCQLVCGARAPVQAFCHGNEVWEQSRVWRLLVQRTRTRLVAVSEFTAGALLGLRPASVLSPSISPARRLALEAVARRRSGRIDGPLRILTVFRLVDFESKGGGVLIEAIERVRHSDGPVELIIAGKSESDHTALDSAMESAGSWVRLIRDPTDSELATLYAGADLFVLATRLRGKPDPWGEGFGIVLLEAAMVGLPVIAPSGGGGHAAFLEGISGLRPPDQSVESLAQLVRWAMHHGDELAVMGSNGRCWAERRFSEEAYRQRVSEVVLGRTSAVSANLALRLIPASAE